MAESSARYVMEKIGGKGKDTLVIARSRTATWAMMPISRKAAFGKKDAEAFLQLVEELQRQSPQKPVKGYVLTAGTIKQERSDLLEQGGQLWNARVRMASDGIIYQMSAPTGLLTWNATFGTWAPSKGTCVRGCASSCAGRPRPSR